MKRFLLHESKKRDLWRLVDTRHALEAEDRMNYHPGDAQVCPAERWGIRWMPVVRIAGLVDGGCVYLKETHG
jgi:hypothetical protein